MSAFGHGASGSFQTQGRYSERLARARSERFPSLSVFGQSPRQPPLLEPAKPLMHRHFSVCQPTPIIGSADSRRVAWWAREVGKR